MNRVAITGLGAVSAAGLGAATAWNAVRDGKSAIGPLECARQDRLKIDIAGQVRDFDAIGLLSQRRAGMMDRFSHFAVVAAREAAAQAGLEAGDPLLAQAGAIIGIGVGGIDTLDDSFHRIYAEERKSVHPLTIPKLMCNAAASQVSMDLGARGMTFAIASACASGTHAIGIAAQMIRTGSARIMITGGSEACIAFGTMMGWEALRVLSFDTCRPFSANRSGLVIGEGAGMLILEAWDHAVGRGAPILGEVIGFGANADAGDLTSPNADGAANAIRLALRDAGLTPDKVGYINAHGTGTMMNDQVESQAIRAAFDGYALPPLSSSKAVLGHALGAAGALEAVVTVQALADQIIPPTANCDQPDESLGVDMVPEGPRVASFDVALSNSFAFGGLNAVLAFGRG